MGSGVRLRCPLLFFICRKMTMWSLLLFVALGGARFCLCTHELGGEALGCADDGAATSPAPSSIGDDGAAVCYSDDDSCDFCESSEEDDDDPKDATFDLADEVR